MYQEIINFIQKTYNTKEFIPLHEPRFCGNEKKYINECIDTSFVSSVGKFVDILEDRFSKMLKSKFAIACVNGTSALHVSLVSIGIKENDEVITQPLTFVATCNAISYTGAKPIFVDVDMDTMGLSANSLQDFLEKNCKVDKNRCINKKTNNTIKACIVMHTFGNPARVDEINDICQKWNITLIEDAAESLGSSYKGRYTGTFGKIGIFSFNGNKIITSGGGGIAVTDDEQIAKRLKHLTTTAKIPHKWEYIHDEIGFNYRMPNINAALLVAQLENLESFLADKRKLADEYANFFSKFDDIRFMREINNSNSNYWLNTILFKNKQQRDEFLEFANKNGVMSRAVWRLMSELDMFKNSQNDGVENSKYLQQRAVNIPSSVRI